MQRKSSLVYSKIYNSTISRFIIKPYSQIQYKHKDKSYLEKFVPASGNPRYQSFQDFFTRKLKYAPELNGDHTWPCEGIICENGRVDKIPTVKVKGQVRDLRMIFGAAGDSIPGDYHYSNVFLHNRDYHRIHAPVSGKVSRVEHIPGELVLLRPWIYPNDPSQPALRNERYNVDITDKAGKTWYMSIVGGPAVGTIMLDKKTSLNGQVKVGEEIATFLLGSTCCMASPIKISKKVGDNVSIGQAL